MHRFNSFIRHIRQLEQAVFVVLKVAPRSPAIVVSNGYGAAGRAVTSVTSSPSLPPPHWGASLRVDEFAPPPPLAGHRRPAPRSCDHLSRKAEISVQERRTLFSRAPIEMSDLFARTSSLVRRERCRALEQKECCSV